ncbi:multidrug effflux MFS transporter [Iodobacter sp. LRB]|uniref:multidrug effflux MFS transporter n=1 Tax=unclassified Iodobacter TaxID=235634 RepID=UPI000C10DDFA|nr:multidrug effflux MFS transporter [Iodobacter sp. BJB302]PHU99723.1 Bcr/CflA family drug resistance efflux transporter [Iodobacter sp. BJB302]
MQKQLPNHPSLVMCLIIMLSPIGQMAIDIYVTALPAMRHDFGVSQQQIQLSVTAYLLSFAIGQLFYGPLADAWGRRSTLLFGLGLYLLGSMLLLSTDHFALFLAARVVQGLGVACGSVVMKALAPDHFTGKELAHVMTYMVIGWGMGPIVAPVLGAQLQIHWGWQSCLYFLLAYGAVLFLMVFFGLKESLKKTVPLKLKLIIENSQMIYANREFQLCFLIMGLCYGVLLSFNLCAPFMVQDVLHRSPVFFGNVALAMGGAYFSGVFSNRIIAGRIAAARLCCSAAMINIFTSIVMVALALQWGLNLFSLIIPTLLITFFSGVIFPNMMARSVSMYPALAGLASSLLGFSLTLCAGLVMYLSSLLPIDSLLPLALLYLFIAISSGAMLFRIYRAEPVLALKSA